MDIDEMLKETRKTWKGLEKDHDYSMKDIEMLYIGLALGGEAGELQNVVKKIFRKKYYTTGHTKEALEAEIPEELADILYYTCRLADLLNIDLSKAFKDKMAENTQRYVNDK